MHSMEQNPPSETNISSNSHETPRILRNMKVLCRVNKSTPLVPYPESDESSPRPSLLLLSYMFYYYPSISCLQVFPTRNLYAIIFSPYVLHALPIFNLKLKGPKLRDLRLLTVSRRKIYDQWRKVFCQYRN